MLIRATDLLATVFQIELPSIEVLLVYAQFALIILVIVVYVLEKIYDLLVNLSVAKRILPERIASYFRNREIDRHKRILRLALSELGFDKPTMAQISQKSQEISINKIRLKRGDCDKILDELVRKYKRRLAQEKSYGTIGKTDIEWPIDFMDAVNNPEELKTLAKIMCSFILDEIEKGEMSGDYEFVAGIRDGNPYFISYVGQYLRKKVIILKSEHTRRYPQDEYDGTDRPADDQEVILVDDCILSGGLKLDTIDKNRFAHNIKHAFVLIERNEGEARKAFEKRGIHLHSLKCFSDQEIGKMKEGTL